MRDIAENYSLPFADVQAAVKAIPQNLWSLLDSPQGWTVMGEQIAIMLGANNAAPIMPQRH